MSNLKLQTSVSAVSNRHVKSNKLNKLAALKAAKDLFLVPLSLIKTIFTYTIGLPLSALLLKDINRRESAASLWIAITFIGGMFALIERGMPADQQLLSYDTSFKLFAAYWLIPLMVFVVYGITEYIVDRYNFHKEG